MLNQETAKAARTDSGYILRAPRRMRVADAVAQYMRVQDIPQETHHETTRLTQSAQVVLWEIDLTEVGGERYFFCNEQNEKGEPVNRADRQYAGGSRS